MKKDNKDKFESAIVEGADKKKQFKFNKTYPAYLILLFLIAVSIMLFLNVKSSLYTSKKADFDKAVSSVVSRLNNQLKQHEEVISSMSEIYDLQEGGIVRDYFELSAALPAQTLNSVQSINFIAKVINANLGDFIYSAKSSGYFEYEIRPQGIRNVYYPIQHIVPLDKNQQMQGLDLFTVKEYKALFDESETSGLTKSTIFFNIRPDTFGFSLLFPAYRYKAERATIADRKRNILGFISVDIKAKEFFDLAINGGIQKTRKIVPSDSLIAFKIYQGKTSKPIYQSQNASNFDSYYKTGIKDLSRFQIYNNYLNIDFCSTPSLGGGFQNNLPMIVLIVSLILSFALFGFILSLMTARAVALDLAERMTRSQRRIVDTSQDIIGIMDFEGNWKSINNACSAIFGKSVLELTGTNICLLLEQEQQEIYISSIDESLKSNYSNKEIIVRLDLEMIGDLNKRLWIEWSLTISKADNLIYAIGRNATLEKEAQNEAEIKTKQIELSEQLIREHNIENSNYMVELSHKIRNNLTSILGYLQFLKEDMYDSKEEMKDFINYSFAESETLFHLVAESIDKGVITTDDTMKIDQLNIIEILKNVEANYSKTNKIITKYTAIDEQNSVVYADENHLTSAFLSFYNILLNKAVDKTLSISYQYNKEQNEIVLTLTAQKNTLASTMINMFNTTRSEILLLRNDKDDIIINLAKNSSKLRAMKSRLHAESISGDAGNRLIITIPTVRTTLE
jgi:PAS domain S-box-containing protein